MSAEELVGMFAFLVEGAIFFCLQEPIFMYIRGTAKKIISWSLVVKIGGSIVGLFWFVQWLRDEFVPQQWEERLRIINLIPHWHWYVRVILALLVCLIGSFEGIYRWNKHEIAPIIGWAGTLQNDAFVVAQEIRDFIAGFITRNGEIPKIYPSNSADEQARMHTAVSNWCVLFSQQFRVTLSDEVEQTIDKIRAQGIPMDYAIEGVLAQPTLNPNSVMLLSGLLMGGGLSLTLLRKVGSIPSSCIS